MLRSGYWRSRYWQSAYWAPIPGVVPPSSGPVAFQLTGFQPGAFQKSPPAVEEDRKPHNFTVIIQLPSETLREFEDRWQIRLAGEDVTESDDRGFAYVAEHVRTLLELFPVTESAAGEDETDDSDEADARTLVIPILLVADDDETVGEETASAIAVIVADAAGDETADDSTAAVSYVLGILAGFDEAQSEDVARPRVMRMDDQAVAAILAAIAAIEAEEA